MSLTEMDILNQNEFGNCFGALRTSCLLLTADDITKVFVLELTHLLTPYSTVLLEKLTGLQLVKKFPAFYGT
jgi:hypothetical protein